MNASSVETSAHRLCTFDLGARRLCIEVAHLQELLRPRAIVPVPLAPPAIAGLTNLRGQIVTAIDLGRLLDPCAGAVDASVAMILVVRTDDGAFGLLVDGIGDVLELDAARGEPPPANLPDAVRALAARAWKLDGASTLEIDVPLVTRPATLAAAAPARTPRRQDPTRESIPARVAPMRCRPPPGARPPRRGGPARPRPGRRRRTGRRTGRGARRRARAHRVRPERIVLGPGCGARARRARRRAGRLRRGQRPRRLCAAGRLELDSLDDGYDPERAVANTRQLVEERGVFAMIASFGTPTSEAVLPALARAGVPYLGPISGAAFLREPRRDNVVNLRPGYDDEAAAWVRHLRADLGARRVAILYQNDAFGRTVLEAARAAMTQGGMKPVAEAGYEPLTIAVKQALLRIRKARPDAVLMAGGHRPVASFVRVARGLDMDPVFMTVSVAGARAVFDELGAKGAGVVFTQVVPSLADDATPIVADYRRALAASDPEATPDPVGLEAYLTARLVAERLGALGSAPTRRALLEDIAGLGSHELGGVTLSFGPDDNQGIDRTWLSVLRTDGEVRYIERLTRAAVSGANR